ncbi:MAG: peptidylprolyl isomerase [Alphaproteobacteria bacterium]|nr:peptidylprolyl isomerase [Alphaproteobacteria bacterium]
MIRPLAIALAIGAVTIPPAQAQSVAGLVNDQIITLRELNARTTLAVLASGLEDTNENRASLQVAVLQEMIDEILRANEAERLDLSVTPEELDSAIADVAARQGASPDEFLNYLRNNGVSPDILKNSILAQILWSKVVQRQYIPQIAVRESEVEAELLRTLSLNNERLYRLSEIFVTVTNPANEKQTEDAIQRLRNAILQGALFSRVAQEFSHSVTAPLGGSLGWLPGTSLSKERRLALETLAIGEISEPVRESGGWVILWLEDLRDTAGAQPFNLIRLSWNPETPREDIEDVHGELGNCRDARTTAENLGDNGRELADILLKDISGPIRDIVRTLKPATASPIYGGGAEPFYIYMLCPPDRGSPAWENTYNRIANARLDSLLRNLERRLRRNAQIEVRL